MGYFKKTNPVLFHFKYIYETACDKWGWNESVHETENGLECGFVKHWLHSV